MWEFFKPSIPNMSGEPVRKSKNFKTLMMNKKTGLIALLASFAAGGAMAATLTNYASGDVLVCFRNGGNDMVVDAGPVTQFTGASANQVIPIGQFSGDQLAIVGTNGTSWSAFTWLADNTLFVTRPRVAPNAPTSPWQAKNSSTQHNTALRMATIPPGAADSFNRNVYPASVPASVLEEDISDGNANYPDGVSYHQALAGSFGGAFNNTFVGNPENTTTNDVADPTQSFTGAGQVQRSDFYKVTPSNGFAFGTFLGYFELNTNGAMNYVAFPLTIPTIRSIIHTNSTTVITYTTGPTGTYTLRGNTSANSGTPIISWTAMAPLASGDVSTHTVSFTDTNNFEIYTITGQ